MTDMDASVEPESGLLDRFHDLLGRDSSANMFHFADRNGVPRDTLTRAELDQRARRIAALLRQRGLRPGDRVLLAYSFSIDVVPALLGCFLAGVVPCPVAPPNPAQLRSELRRFEDLARDSGCKSVLTNGEYARYRRLANLRSPLLTRNTLWRELPWLKTDGVLPSPIRDWHSPGAGDTAFLQYTSGSTAAPKGVVINFRNIEAQLDTMRRRCAFDQRSRLVAWVPYYHDHCLVGGILNVMFGGGELYLLSPLTFLQSPAAWFDLLMRVRATATAAPNFAFRYSVRKTTEEQRRQWDLSSLDLLQSGGEPVLSESVDAFVDAFRPSGLRAEAVSPAYGMAEHVLGISVGGGKRVTIDRSQYEQANRVVMGDGPGTRTLIGNGRPLDGVRVEIVDPDTCRRLGPGDVGEIWVDSDCKAAGYWGKPELSDTVFAARLAGDPSAARFLRSGDLGFFHDGELFVSGRIKDTIIIRGRNIFPQDVETAVSTAHPSIRPGRAVAFSHSTDSEGEHLAVIAEVRTRQLSAKEAQDIADAMRRQVSAEMAVSCRTVILARPETVSKTTSGKHQRLRTRANFQSGALARRVLWSDTLVADVPAVHALAGPEQLSEPVVLERMVSHVAAIEGRQAADVDVDAPLESFALDSLALMGLVLETATWSGRDLSHETFTEAGSLRGAARALMAMPARTATVRPALPGDVAGAAIAVDHRDRRYPLNPSQAWMFEPEGPVPHGWTVGGMVQTPLPVDVACMQQALDAVVEHHEVLRIRAVHTTQGWQQYLLDSDAPQLEVVDLFGLGGAALRDEIERLVAQRKRTMNIVDGPVVQLVVLRLDKSQADRLLLLLHHIAVDAYAAELVASDLIRAYEQLLAGQGPALVSPGTSYTGWMEAILEMAASADVRASADYFFRMPVAPQLQQDRPGGRNLNADYTSQASLLPLATSLQLLQTIPSATAVPAAVLLLSTLCQALHDHLGETRYGFELVHHGRKDAVAGLDLSRTCGWTSINCPVTFEVDPKVDPIVQARQIQATIDELPRKGLDYGLLAFLHPDEELRNRLRKATRPEMKFMWFGQAQGMLQALAGRYPPAPETVGGGFDEAASAHYLQYFYGGVHNGCVRLDVGSSRECYTDATRLSLLSAWTKRIDDLLAASRPRTTHALTMPS